MLKLFLKVILMLLAVAGGRLAYEKALGLPFFALQEITLTGNSGLNIDSAAAVAGLERGKSIYHQNLNYAAANIMRQPGVIGCSVKRGHVSSIAIDIQVAEPALLVNCGDIRALSREGMVLPVTDDMPILPLVSGRGFANVQCYELLRNPDIAYALSIHDALLVSSPGLTSRLSEINFSPEECVNLYFSPAATVVLDKGGILNGIKRLSVLDKSGMMPDTAVLDLRFGPVMIESPVAKGAM